MLFHHFHRLMPCGDRGVLATVRNYVSFCFQDTRRNSPSVVNIKMIVWMEPPFLRVNPMIAMTIIAAIDHESRRATVTFVIVCIKDGILSMDKWKD